MYTYPYAYYQEDTVDRNLVSVSNKYFHILFPSVTYSLKIFKLNLKLKSKIYRIKLNAQQHITEEYILFIFLFKILFNII